jgi:hypothetical protein
MHSDTEERETSDHGSPSRWHRARAWVPAVAVAAVAAMAVFAAFVVPRFTPGDPSPTPAAVAAHDLLEQARKTVGAAPACRDCGVVQSVEALARDPAAYRMQIRMDDGTVRMVEQPGALPAGSRVMVAGGGAHRIAGRTGPG